MVDAGIERGHHTHHQGQGRRIGGGLQEAQRFRVGRHQQRWLWQGRRTKGRRAVHLGEGLRDGWLEDGAGDEIRR